jgi:16S rRNA (cytosine967-C5)-methyltransferase
MKINARKLALRILDEIDQTHDFSHLVVNRTFQRYDIESADRRFVSHIVFGVLENKLLLDYYIRKLSAQRFSRIDPSIVNILRMGLYQLVYMTKVPDSAAVDESVKLAKGITAKDSSFVNGILRTFLRSNKTIELPDRNKHLVTHLGIKYSFPEWLVEMWLKAYGEKTTEGLLEASNKTPQLSLRVNTLQTDLETLQNKLDAVGIVSKQSELVPTGLVIESLNNLAMQEIPGYSEGDFIIQDISSMCVAHLSGVKDDQTVLDVCAAPGGKTTHMAQLMHNSGRIIARDNQADKLETINENVARLKIKNVIVEQYDALTLDESLINTIDVVLVDAPCSGLGIIRRKPDIKYNKTPEGLLGLIDIQKGILKNAAEYVKVGGTLMYSTCTLNPAENQDIVNWFLKQDTRFKVQPLSEVGYLTLFPNTHDTDGFFIAKLNKIDE